MNTSQIRRRHITSIIILFGAVATIGVATSVVTADPDENEASFENSLRDAVSQRDHFLLSKGMYAALDQLNETNLPQAVAIVEEHADRIYRMQAFDIFLRYWATIEPEAAVEYCMQKLTDAERDQVIGAALHSWAMNDPEAAITWVENNAKGNFRYPIFPVAIVGWALVDLPAATEYVQAMPPGDDRMWSIRRLAKTHLQNGLPAFEKWLDGLEDPAEKILAIDWAASRAKFAPELASGLKTLSEKAKAAAEKEIDEDTASKHQ